MGAKDRSNHLTIWCGPTWFPHGHPHGSFWHLIGHWNSLQTDCDLTFTKQKIVTLFCRVGHIPKISACLVIKPLSNTLVPMSATLLSVNTFIRWLLHTRKLKPQRTDLQMPHLPKSLRRPCLLTANLQITAQCCFSIAHCWVFAPTSLKFVSDSNVTPRNTFAHNVVV